MIDDIRVYLCLTINTFSWYKMAPMPPHAAVKEMGDEIKRKQELQKWLDENQYSR
jgi:hypothetical protein